MVTSAERLRAYQGPALFSYGFRPFFLGGALWAALTMAAFIIALTGAIAIPSAMPPTVWHAHELLYGFLPAIVAGFILTAVPNWTGRLPIAGWPLAGLAGLWLAGRIAIAFSGVIGAGMAAAIDAAFLLVLIAVIGREIVAGGNTRNLKVLVLIGLLFAGNAAFHAEFMAQGFADYGNRVGIGAAVMLIVVIGGRIVPSFTRNWLVRENPGGLPAPMDRFDIAAILVAAAAIAAWVAAPLNAVTGALLALAGALHLGRLARWRGWRTFAEPLVTVLHLGYAFIPLGFAVLALSVFSPAIIPPSSAVHGWTAGAVGVMTLAVMTRASLGHTGGALTASPAIVAIYAAVTLGALARLVSGLGIMHEPMLHLAALGWMGAFAGFVFVFAPHLLCAQS
ncbi:MAG: NnrS family protein [Dichotomicrobium sp.]